MLAENALPFAKPAVRAVKVALKFAPTVTVTVQYASVTADVRIVACVWIVQKAQTASVKNVISVAYAQQCVLTVVKPAKVVQKSAPNAQVTAQPATAITVALTVANALIVHQMVLASAKAVCFARTVL